MTPNGPSLPIPFLGYSARLAEPGELWLLLLVAFLALLGAFGIYRRRRALHLAAGLLERRIAPSANTTRPAVRLGLSLTGLVLLVLALARPQCGTHTELARRFGADIAIVLDASRSMTARDVKPDRLTRARLELGNLIDELAGDRVAVVVFAGQAFVQCPLTSDYAAVRLFMRAIDPEAMPQQGTSLREALVTAKDALLSSERAARAKVVLVVSDGEDQEGGAKPAARMLANAGIVVHALAVGTRAGAPIPVLDPSGNVIGYKKDKKGETVVTHLDDATLLSIATAGGGEVFDLESPGHGIAAFKAELDKMGKTELESRLATVYEDRYAFLAFPALLFLLGGLLFREGAAVSARTDRELKD